MILEVLQKLHWTVQGDGNSSLTTSIIIEIIPGGTFKIEY